MGTSLRLEGEKASLERIIQNELKKKKQLSEKEEPPKSPKETVSPEPVPEPASKSATATLDQLIKALGHLPPTAEEIIAKLKNQVTFLKQVNQCLVLHREV